MFFNPKPFLSLNSVIYISKKSNKLVKNEINYQAVLYLENAFMKKYLEKFKSYLEETFPVKNKVYTSVEQFINDNTSINSLNFKQIKTFFYLHILLISKFTILKILYKLLADFKSQKLTFK